MIILFFLLLIVICFKFLFFSLRAAWSLAWVLLAILFFPLIMVVMVLVGLLSFAMPILLIVGLAVFLFTRRAF